VDTSTLIDALNLSGGIVDLPDATKSDEDKSLERMKLRLKQLEQLIQKNGLKTSIETNEDYFKWYIKKYFLDILKEISDQYHGALPIESDRMNEDFISIYNGLASSVSLGVPVNPLNLLGVFFKLLAMVDHRWAHESLAHADKIMAYLPQVDLLAEKLAENLANHYALVIKHFNRGQVKKLADAALEILLRLFKEGGWLQDFSKIEDRLDYDELANLLTHDIIFSHAKSFVKFDDSKNTYADDALWKGGFLLVSKEGQAQYFHYKNAKENGAKRYPPVILFESQLPDYMNGNFLGWYHQQYLPVMHSMSMKRVLKTNAKHVIHTMSELLTQEGLFASHDIIDNNALNKYLTRLSDKYGLVEVEDNQSMSSTHLALLKR